ncbi:tryptophan halogenase family protein [Stakelama marina]|uniref:Tryptophan 7-halogenase n=1 Tax=Stakelama marina TaxID=2826939 RepID=A0A8T4IBY5_9SPHN|nr:tryptophan 7-halogenase [Stakelama marina]MBR0552167.1 tryptophan 7-halogenase [Stakelama marina]
MKPIRSIAIVGGGTSGWLAAAYLARKLGTAKGGVAITLIESPDIATVGVGEATIPPIRSMVAATGISEGEFLRETGGSFKLAIRFDDWLHVPSEHRRHSYYHAFGSYGRIGRDLMAPYWLQQRDTEQRSFVDYTMPEGRICDAMCAPKRRGDPEFSGPFEYAYHFDAARAAKLLQRVAVETGVKHLLGKVENVELDANGDIAALVTDRHGKLEADLFIDCTGFAALLIEKALGVRFDDATDQLFCDRAVVCRPLYETPDAPIPPFTVATARPHGWIWDIPLSERRGVGYVYSSRYCEAEDAERNLRSYLGEAGRNADSFEIRIRVGSRPTQWHRNCIAIGLAGGFIEPLESTGIYLVDIALRWLSDLFPDQSTMKVAAQEFNRRMNDCYADIIDFVKLHYCISKRDDTRFWIDNRNQETWPETLKRKLENWRFRTPGEYEVGGLPAVFGLSNYLQVLYGMQYFPDLSGREAQFANMEHANERADELQRTALAAVDRLPEHRELIGMIAGVGTGIFASKL